MSVKAIRMEDKTMLSRRSFLKSTLGAGLALATQGCQQMAAQPARKRIIVDAQVHLWKAESPDWPWVPGLKPQLPEPFTIEKLVPMMDEAGVDRAVIVPPSWPGDRNDYAIEAAKRYPNRFAVMGRIPLQDRKSADLLPKWKQQPGMLGVRVTFNTPTMIGWLSDGTADWFWPAAEKAGLPVMFLAFGLLPKFAPIAERHPQLTLIIDHMGVNAVMAKEKRIPAAIEHAVALAKYPNVSIKMSAAPNMSLESYPFRDVTEHLRRVFDAYEPQRCYWGTDMTNSFAKATYRQRITHFTEELSFLTESDKDWVMGRAILERLKWT
jgi:predicted TIM-barrel fold metal-dependent hydrolase